MVQNIYQDDAGRDVFLHIYSFNGEDLKMMLVGSVNLPAESRAEIDALNVFPVPNGDNWSILPTGMIRRPWKSCGPG